MLHALLATALADTARTLDGERVDTSEVLVHAWSIEDADSLDTLHRLEGVEGVVAVNTDAASLASQVRFVARTVDVPVIADPTGRLAAEHASTSQIAAAIAAAEASVIATR